MFDRKACTNLLRLKPEASYTQGSEFLTGERLRLSSEGVKGLFEEVISCQSVSMDMKLSASLV